MACNNVVLNFTLFCTHFGRNQALVPHRKCIRRQGFIVKVRARSRPQEIQQFFAQSLVASSLPLFLSPLMPQERRELLLLLPLADLEAC